MMGLFLTKKLLAVFFLTEIRRWQSRQGLCLLFGKKSKFEKNTKWGDIIEQDMVILELESEDVLGRVKWPRPTCPIDLKSGKFNKSKELDTHGNRIEICGHGRDIE